MPATRTRNMDSHIRAAFLDRDGVINIDSGYVCRRDEFVFVPRAVEACRILSRAGFKLFVVTNQSGIGRGYYTEEDFLRLTSWMQNEMASDGAPIEKVYFCPHHPDAKIERYRRVCRCRKPQPGMILDAIGEFGIDPARSVIFGDSPRDMEAGAAAGVRERILLGTDGKAIPSASADSTAVFNNLLSAVTSPWFRSFCTDI